MCGLYLVGLNFVLVFAEGSLRERTRPLTSKRKDVLTDGSLLIRASALIPLNEVSR